MSDRDDKLNQFIAGTKFRDAKQDRLASDASKRSYVRLTQPHSGQTALVMNAPPEAGEETGPFIIVTGILREANLSAPEIFEKDVENGFLLIEDFGDQLFADICANDPDREVSLYKQAIDLLVYLNQTVEPKDVKPYSTDVYLAEAELLTEWYMPATGIKVTEALKAEYRTIIRAICEELDNNQEVLVLRDYHAENLMDLADRTGHKSVGLLDYQDALIGHRAYDLVSLLQDARRDTSEKLQSEMLERFIAKSHLEDAKFRRDYAILGAQRNLKIVGIFTRLWLRDNKPDYLDLIPRVWEHLQKDLEHPSLWELKNWVHNHVPSPSPEILTAIKTP